MFQTGQVVWAHIRGFPWWPGRVTSPTAAQLKRLSTERIPPDHRFVWFFNDNDRYKLIHVKNIRPFRNEEITLQTKSKTGKHSAQLKQAFESASAEYRPLDDLDDEEPIDAVVIIPPTTQQPRSVSANQSGKSKKREISSLTPSPHLEELPPREVNNRKKNEPTILTLEPPRTRRKPVRQSNSHKKPQSSARTSGDAESDRLSTHCNPSPSDRSSQETGIDSGSNLATAKHTPPRSNLLRLRVRPKRPSPREDKQNESPELESSLSKHGEIEKRERSKSTGEQLRKKEQCTSLGRKEHRNRSVSRANDDSSRVGGLSSQKDVIDLSGREKKRKVSDLPPRLRHGALYDGGDAAKRRRLTSSKGDVASTNPGLSEVCILDSALDISSEDENMEAAQGRKPISEQHPSTEITRVLKSDRVGQSHAPLRRSRRMRKVSMRIEGGEEDSDRESEGDAQQPVASKRSRGMEAPRMSDGQRRVHTRQVKKGMRNGVAGGKNENGRRFSPYAEHLDEEKISDSDLFEMTGFFQDVSKDECIKAIYKLRETLRRKNVQLWLRGRKLVDARGVLRTEEGLIRACESGIERAEDLLRWVKKQEGYEKGEGSPFAKMEAKAIEECEVLVDVYFDRRRVGLKKIGPRILELTKGLAAHSARVTEVLLDLVVLWLDLTSSSAKKKMADIKSK